MKKLLNTILIVIVVFFNSCSEKWFEIKPKGQGYEESFSSQEGVESLLIGAYAVLDGVNGRTGDGWASAVTNWVWGGVASDDAYKGSNPGDQSQINMIEGFFADAENLYVAQHWAVLYDGVSRTNEVLRAITRAQDMTEIERGQAEAQARFLRAHFYFELTIVHGKVPFIDIHTENPSHVPNDRLLWPEIEADMEFAKDNLPLVWEDKGRPTQWAAKTYLARVYLHQQKFAEAKVLLEDVYRNGGFSLMPSYEMNYMIAYNNNAESIFEIQYAVNDGFGGSPNAGLGDGINGPHFMGSSGFYQPSHSLVSAYRVNDAGLPLLDDDYSADDILPHSSTGSSVLYTAPVDPRLDHSFGRPGVPYLDWGVHQGDTWIRNVSNGGPYINKKAMFKKSEQGSLSSTSGRPFLNANNYRKFKLSHVILWLAECEAEVGTLAEATRLVNLIRNRAKQSEVVRFDDGSPAANYKVELYAENFPTREYARKAIQHEIRIELAMEGYRFFDLVRWGIAGETLNRYFQVEGAVMEHLRDKSFSVGQHEIWPVPQRQIDLSVKEGTSVLLQNQGY